MFSAAQLIHNCNTTGMSLWVWEACSLYSVSWCFRRQVVPAMGSGWWFTLRAAVPLHSQFTRCKPHPRPAHAVPSSLLLGILDIARCPPQHKARLPQRNHALRADLCHEWQSWGQRRPFKPWKPSQCAAAMLCSCECAPAVKRALWPQTRAGTTLGTSIA